MLVCLSVKPLTSSVAENGELLLFFFLFFFCHLTLLEITAQLLTSNCNIPLLNRGTCLFLAHMIRLLSAIFRSTS